MKNRIKRLELETSSSDAYLSIYGWLSTVIEKCSLKLRDGTTLFGKIRKENSSHWLVAVHGVGEHCGRHDYLKDIFRFNLLQYDLRGHGQSEGRRAWIDNFSTFVDDLADILVYLKREHGMEKFVLFGHSLGGLIALSYLLHPQRKEFSPEKVFLGAPPLRIGGKLGIIADGIPYSLMKGPLLIPSQHSFESHRSPRSLPRP